MIALFSSFYFTSIQPVYFYISLSIEEHYCSISFFHSLSLSLAQCFTIYLYRWYLCVAGIWVCAHSVRLYSITMFSTMCAFFDTTRFVRFVHPFVCLVVVCLWNATVIFGWLIGIQMSVGRWYVGKFHEMIAGSEKKAAHTEKERDMLRVYVIIKHVCECMCLDMPMPMLVSISDAYISMYDHIGGLFLWVYLSFFSFFIVSSLLEHKKYTRSYKIGTIQMI